MSDPERQKLILELHGLFTQVSQILAVDFPFALNLLITNPHKNKLKQQNIIIQRIPRGKANHWMEANTMRL